jgi:hypothetical protein
MTNPPEIPRLLIRRAQREIERRRPGPWTLHHDAATIKLLFKWGSLTHADLELHLDDIKNRLNTQRAIDHQQGKINRPRIW